MCLSLALEAGVSAGEGTDLIDINGERAVRFLEDPIVSHASEYGTVLVSLKRGHDGY